jgi:uncharacterized alkaline shock family protein YloU
MSEQKSGQKGQQQSPLQSERGNTSVANVVVAKVAGIAAQEIEGVRMGSGGSQTVSGFLSNFGAGAGGNQTQGVSVEVGDVEAAVDLTTTVEYGKSIPQVSEAVRRNVVNRIENLVGLRVTEVNINVNNVYFPEAEDQDQQQIQDQGQQTQGRAQ